MQYFPRNFKHMRNAVLLLTLLLLSPLFTLAQEQVDLNMMQKIRNEGINNSQVMDIAWNLTDGSGPRVTASPGFLKAANYAKQTLVKCGVKNVRIEPWGEFGKGWELQKSYVAMTAPYYKPIIAFPKVWTSGTNGLQNAEVVLITAKDSAGLDAYRGKLKGKIIILDRMDTYKQSFNADAGRYTDAQLDSMANIQAGARQPQGNRDTAEIRRRREEFRTLAAFNNTLRMLAKTEGAVAMLSTSPRSHDGTVFVQGASGNPYKITDAESALDLSLSWEDYMTILRTVKRGASVKLDIDVKTNFQTADTKGYNVIGEIPGTDLKDEIVMLGAHLDSWQGATGATDNASGSAVMLEVMRILKSIGATPRRTIRIALWSGEEQGLLGSRAYVKNTFGDRTTMQLINPAHEKFSAYYNIDNGTGKVRGIYLQGNEAARSIFTAWFQPLKDLGAGTVTISNTGGTDHLSFDEVGLPGFQFIQDEIEYDTRTHHSNMDSYDHLIPDDLKQISIIVASFVYNTAMRTEKIPRKELPKPRNTTGGM
jgi:carboxypeptidase Q